MSRAKERTEVHVLYSVSYVKQGIGVKSAINSTGLPLSGQGPCQVYVHFANSTQGDTASIRMIILKSTDFQHGLSGCNSSSRSLPCVAAGTGVYGQCRFVALIWSFGLSQIHESYD
jgi:hypothetical protein